MDGLIIKWINRHLPPLRMAVLNIVIINMTIIIPKNVTIPISIFYNLQMEIELFFSSVPLFIAPIFVSIFFISINIVTLSVW